MSPLVALVAAAVRVIPLWRGGGLLAWGRYDDGVYYTAAASLLDGRVPYRDFVLLHPPLIVLVLQPFALLGRFTTDPTGLAAARVTWLLLGTLTAVLVARYAARWGTAAGLVAGLWVACSASASYASQATFIEPAADLALFGGLVLLTCDRERPRHELVAGLLLGIALTGKIWYVAPVGVLLLVLLLTRIRGRRPVARVLRVGGAAALTAAVILLPFFALAPRQMWRMVVYDQLGRPRHGHTSPIDRLGYAVGGRDLGLSAGPTAVVTAIATIAFVVALMACLRDPRARLVAAVAMTCVAVLLLSPVVFHHYGDFPAASVAATLGIGWSLVGARLLRAGPPRRLLGAAATAAIVLAGVPVLLHPLGRVLPHAAIAALPSGCIAADDPTTLILADRLSSDLRAGCEVQVDVTGASYGVKVGRHQNLSYVEGLLAYLRSGSAMIVARRAHDGLGIPQVRALGTETYRETNVHVIVPDAGQAATPDP